MVHDFTLMTHRRATSDPFEFDEPLDATLLVGTDKQQQQSTTDPAERHARCVHGDEASSSKGKGDPCEAGLVLELIDLEPEEQPPAASTNMVMRLASQRPGSRGCAAHITAPLTPREYRRVVEVELELQAEIRNQMDQWPPAMEESEEECWEEEELPMLRMRPAAPVTQEQRDAAMEAELAMQVDITHQMEECHRREEAETLGAVFKLATPMSREQRDAAVEAELAMQCEIARQLEACREGEEEAAARTVFKMYMAAPVTQAQRDAAMAAELAMQCEIARQMEACREGEAAAQAAAADEDVPVRMVVRLPGQSQGPGQRDCAAPVATPLTAEARQNAVGRELAQLAHIAACMATMGEQPSRTVEEPQPSCRSPRQYRTSAHSRARRNTVCAPTPCW